MFDNAGVPGGDPQGNGGTCLQHLKGFPDGLEVVDLMLGAVERVAKLATGSLGIQGTFKLKQIQSLGLQFRSLRGSVRATKPQSLQRGKGFRRFFLVNAFFSCFEVAALGRGLANHTHLDPEGCSADIDFFKFNSKIESWHGSNFLSRK